MQADIIEDIPQTERTAERRVIMHSAGDRHGPITRLMSPGDLGQAAQARKKATLERFAPACQDAFLSGYHSVEGAHLNGLSARQQADLLDLLTLEKAAYEICYEAANRPAWITVPLRGLAAIVSRLLDTPARSRKSEKGNTEE